MTIPPPDGSRDRRIEDPTNLWIIHPAARMLLPAAIARGISANAVSLVGLAAGAFAALAYARWSLWPCAVAGFALSLAWLVADGLDGMVARATNSASALGRFLDGLCDHGVFVLIYLALAISLDSAQGWALAVGAGALHAVQSSLYEGERARYHRRIRGIAAAATGQSVNLLVRVYDGLAGAADRLGRAFDATLAAHPDPARVASAYGDAAARPLALMSLLSANMRVCVIFLACLAGDPRLFWWFEIVPLTAILVIGLVWHRAIERQLVSAFTLRPTASQKDATRS